MLRIVLCTLAVSGCAGRVPGRLPAGGQVVITVNGEHTITRQMVEGALRLEASGDGGSLENGDWSPFAEPIAVTELLYHQALEQGLHSDADVRTAVGMHVRELLARELLLRMAEARVTEDAIQRTYEADDRYARPQVHARHILVESEVLAIEVLARLSLGEDFAELARALTIDEWTRHNGGDLGWLTRQDMIDEVASAAFDGPMGELQGPIHTPLGYHVLETLERRDAIPLDAVRDAIGARLRGDVRAAIVDEIWASLELDIVAPPPVAR